MDVGWGTLPGQPASVLGQHQEQNRYLAAINLLQKYDIRNMGQRPFEFPVGDLGSEKSNGQPGANGAQAQVAQLTQQLRAPLTFFERARRAPNLLISGSLAVLVLPLFFASIAVKLSS